ncbi:hypothetical protein [Stenotrophomonas indicatrix]|uniref:hypothetical protein n=1 Tax=Stenotrophomonas indicatrix TaxID=2045451 RepID=UPI001CBE67A6|nr:hypothetical protein [Stenotrophomonas indicatrix]
MDIHLPASQPVSNATIHGNAIDCTIGEEIVCLQVAVHENQCCEAQLRRNRRKRKPRMSGAFFSAANERSIRTVVTTKRVNKSSLVKQGRRSVRLSLFERKHLHSSGAPVSQEHRHGPAGARARDIPAFKPFLYFIQAQELRHPHHPNQGNACLGANQKQCSRARA